jgi:hypothetical protein
MPRNGTTEIIDQETGEVFATLDPAARRIHELYTEFRGMVCGALGRALEIGKVLEGKRAECEGNGKKGKGFKAWCEEVLPFKRAQAYRYLGMWEKFGPCLPRDTRSFEYKAAERFLPKSVPDEAVDEAVDRATNGEHISEEVAKAIIAKHKPEPEAVEFDVEKEESDLSHYINMLMERCPVEHMQKVFLPLIQTADILRKSNANL